jgi:hypothetical protein
MDVRTVILVTIQVLESAMIDMRKEHEMRDEEQREGLHRPLSRSSHGGSALSNVIGKRDKRIGGFLIAKSISSA